MRFLGRRAAITAVTAIFGLGLLGTAAFAALAPAPSATAAPDTLAATTAQVKGDRLKAILDALVARGVITRAQADAILAALAEEAREERREDVSKRVFASLLEQSAAYLDMPAGRLKAALPGTSLAVIANATPGKSADGLKAYLLEKVNAAIAKALAEGTITQAQADRVTAAAPDHIARYVAHIWPEHKPRSQHPNVQAFIGDVLAAARDELGLSREDLGAALRSGKSLGEIANATPGKSRDGLVAAITASANAKIDAAVQQGRLTAEQAAKLRESLAKAVPQAVDRAPGTIKSR